MTFNGTAATGQHAVAYYRVSTQRQGQSGLGLEAQRTAVLSFAQGRGLVIVAEFQEVETGTKKGTRPQLQAALAQCRRSGAVLVIARLDRLARNVRFIASLMESGVAFQAADMPDAQPLVLHIMSAVAEQQAARISLDTRAALAARRARGLPLGNPAALTPERRAAGAATMRRAAIEATRPAGTVAALLRDQGLSLRQIAQRLDAVGIPARRGGGWGPQQVSRLLERHAAIESK
ncbi:resolvase [Deinococcus seoulensis]|uniref:Resolvase n=1 Tax=Deinococcus seoulensis TaxID=1837379 RepID=A0ABQ2RWS2_9DEIO|nr:recombinase family protein [Deinococcus seoulensis]GGR75735.1 resolvase [Deinococcus seoulensis]